MEIQHLTSFDGPNIFSYKPTVQMIVKLGDLVDTPTKELKNFNERIIKMFPGLVEHKCSLGCRGGFIRRLQEGTYLAHVTEHLCLEMQYLLGYDCKFGRTRQLNDDVYQIIYGCKHPKVGEECAKTVINIINQLIMDCEIQWENELNRLKTTCLNYEMGFSTRAIAEEARKRGIPVSDIDNSGILRLGYGKYQKIIAATLYENTSSVAVDIACDKTLTKYLLNEVSIPTPPSCRCATVDDALNFAQEYGYPLVLKPNSGHQGHSVCTNLSSPAELSNAFKLMLSNDVDDIIIEKQIQGKDYRVLVINGKAEAAALRVPPFIKGDGKSTIKELIDQLNQDELRGFGHEKALTKIEVDDLLKDFISKQGYTITSIPAKNKLVYLRANANLSTGGMAIDCTDLIHPQNKELAERAAKAIGLDIAGIDIISPDLAIPLVTNQGAIIEVNAAPGIRMHLKPFKGKSRNIVAPILDMIYPPGKPASIPLITITGTNGKTTTTRMIGHVLKKAKYNVGMTTTHGIYFNDNCLEYGDTTGPRSAKKVLNNRLVDIAVLETARGGILRDGLAYEKADIAVFTNLTNDHLGIDNINSLEDLLNVKSLVIEAVHKNGTCVLNADDEWVMKVKEKAQSNIILYSTRPQNPYLLQHVQNGGEVIYQSGEYIYYSNGHVAQKIIKVQHIPATLNGSLKHNIYNSLAAIGALKAFGLPLEQIETSMQSFYSDERTNPGRFNIYEIKDFKVILDYGHNFDGYKFTIEGIKNLQPNRMIGVIGVPGDRRDEDIRQVGELCGESFDYLIIKEDKNLRGRKRTEVANLLYEAAAQKNPFLEIILEEEIALIKALEYAQKGDIIAVFFEEFESLAKILNSKIKNLQV
ncbi:cyanophycin synthetase [Bacillota bacterium LX-D]|nr:cyanophycin synthetase [Bacillota bacterium LX-D]